MILPPVGPDAMPPDAMLPDAMLPDANDAAFSGHPDVPDGDAVPRSVCPAAETSREAIERAASGAVVGSEASASDGASRGPRRNNVPSDATLSEATESPKSPASCVRSDARDSESPEGSGGDDAVGEEGSVKDKGMLTRGASCWVSRRAEAGGPTRGIGSISEAVGWLVLREKPATGRGSFAMLASPALRADDGRTVPMWGVPKLVAGD